MAITMILKPTIYFCSICLPTLSGYSEGSRAYNLPLRYMSWVGMGIVENSTVRFGSRFCFYGSVLLRFPKQFINDISWICLNWKVLESSYILAPWALSLRSEGF